jgi:HPt (histidine-containing phosphotransfer) domain-containing protein
MLTISPHIADPLEDLRVRFLRRVSRDIAALSEHRAALKGGAVPPQTLDNIKQVAHSLSGAGGIYGFQDISDAAAALEDAALARLAAEGSDEMLSGALDELIALAPPEQARQNPAVTR